MPEATEATFRRGVRLCFDWGKARIGVAACDPDGRLAYPVETVANDTLVWQRSAELVAEYAPIEIVLGMPIDLRGRRGVAADSMCAVARQLADHCGVPVRLVDERMTTGQATELLAEAGIGARSRRSIIDQQAAVEILDQAIARERHGGAPGQLIEPRGVGHGAT